MHSIELVELVYRICRACVKAIAQLDKAATGFSDLLGVVSRQMCRGVRFPEIVWQSMQIHPTCDSVLVLNGRVVPKAKHIIELCRDRKQSPEDCPRQRFSSTESRCGHRLWGIGSVLTIAECRSDRDCGFDFCMTNRNITENTIGIVWLCYSQKSTALCHHDSATYSGLIDLD